MGVPLVEAKPHTPDEDSDSSDDKTIVQEAPLVEANSHTPDVDSDSSDDKTITQEEETDQASNDLNQSECSDQYLADLADSIPRNEEEAQAILDAWQPKDIELRCSWEQAKPEEQTKSEKQVELEGKAADTLKLRKLLKESARRQAGDTQQNLPSVLSSMKTV